MYSVIYCLLKYVVTAIYIIILYILWYFNPLAGELLFTSIRPDSNNIIILFIIFTNSLILGDNSHMVLVRRFVEDGNNENTFIVNTGVFIVFEDYRYFVEYIR